MNRIGRRVEFIENQKKRNSTFMKRRSGLINKARELSILCGVDACMIINAPKENNNNDEPVNFTWSSSSDSDVTVQKLIKKYKEPSVEDRRKKDYNVSNYFADKLASLKKEKRKACKLSTWNSKLDTMKERELRDLASDLEIKIDNLKSRRELMKNKRIKTGIDSGYKSSPRVDQESRSTGYNNLQPVTMMEPNYLIPIAMNSLHHNSNNNSQAIDRNQMKMAMNSIEDENNFNYPAIINSKMKMVTNSIDYQNNYNVQPIALIKPDDVNLIGLPMFDHYTPTDSQPQFSSSSSSMMNPAMMSTDVPESLVYEHNAYNFSVLGCLSMQQAYASRNSRMENCVPGQSFYDLPLPPLMFEHSTNRHVSSQMQYSEQLGLHYNLQ